MLATQEAQVIPMTQMKHFWALISFPEVACDPVPLLTPGLFDDAKWGRSGGPELTGHDFSWLWILFANSVEKKEQSDLININESGLNITRQYDTTAPPQLYSLTETLAWLSC